jgi:predicted O-methyltransferase YrrM
MEFGGGGSTLWFAERVRRVVCYENNLEWYTALDNKNLDNVVLQFGSFPLEEETDKDLLLIDGEPVRLRAGWLREAQRIVKRGGWIILDNANRREYARERADLSAFAVLEYQSELVGKHLITEIWKVL